MESPIYRLEGVVKAKESDMEDFVGPLDLILHLLSKNKMEIKDIQISLILEQYLEWMNQRKELDLEVASEFVTMASHLIYIKEGITRIENINELKSTVIAYMNDAEEPSLNGFLEEIALYTDLDKMAADEDAVTMMTVHSAKGLEFTNVFVIGMEDGIFPSGRSMDRK